MSRTATIGTPCFSLRFDFFPMMQICHRTSLYRSPRNGKNSQGPLLRSYWRPVPTNHIASPINSPSCPWPHSQHVQSNHLGLAGDVVTSEEMRLSTRAVYGCRCRGIELHAPDAVEVDTTRPGRWKVRWRLSTNNKYGRRCPGIIAI